MIHGRKSPVPSTLTAALTADHQVAFVTLLDNFRTQGYGIDQMPGFQGVPLLHFAVLQKRLWAVEELLRRGADPNLKTAIGRTALDIALDQDSPAPREIAALLAAHGASVNGSFRVVLQERARTMKKKGFWALKGTP